MISVPRRALSLKLPKWFCALFLSSLLAGQSLDERIAKLQQHVAPKLHSARVPGAGERLSAVLDQTRRSLANPDPDPAVAAACLRDQRRNLAVLDEAYQAEFASIEARLRHAALPAGLLAERLATWHSFTANYRRRMDSSLAAFDRVNNEASAHDAKWLRNEAAGLLAGLGADRPRITSISDRPAANAKPRLPAQTTTPANDTPTADDLAANGAVVLSPDIVTLAASLGNSPPALFGYVYNNIQFTPYYMSVQSSESVLWSGVGNDADQATLLIALLRASGIPARYVQGNINVPAADVLNWLGVKDTSSATKFLSMNTNYTQQGSSFSILHVWVEAWLNNAWVPMTPSIKRQIFQPGILFTPPAFNRTQFLSTVQPRLASELYAAQLQTAFQQAHPGADFSAMAYTGTIIPFIGVALPPFPYPAGAINARGAAVPGHTITVVLQLKTIYLNATVTMPQVSTSSLTLAFIPATANDQKIITSFGGLANTPANMVNLLPQLLLNEQVVATGSTPVPYGTEVGLEVGHTEADATKPDRVYDHVIIAGENTAITVNYNQVSERLIGTLTDGLLGQVSTASADLVTRELLAIAGMRYFQRVNIEKARVFDPLQIASPLPFPQEAATVASLKVTNLFDRPFLVTPGTLLIDAKATGARGYDLNAGAADSTTVPGDVGPSQAVEAASSGLENQIWEELVLIPSISTVKALQINGQAGIPLYALSAGNASNLSSVAAPTLIAQSVTADLKSGATDTISAKPTVFGVWTGFGWIVEAPGSFSYVILQTNTPANGGTNGGNPPQPMPPTNNPGNTGNFVNAGGMFCSDPVSVSNGNMFHQHTDLSLSSRGPAVAIRRTYNSLAASNRGPIGYGWTLNYAMSVKDNQTTVTFTDDSGGVYAFALQNGAYVSPPGLDLALAKTANGYTIRTTHGTIWTFDTSGKLTSVADRNRNAVTLGYDGSNRLAQITDALSRVVTLSYDVNNRIVAIRDFTGRQVTYQYDASSNLSAMTDAAGNTTTYSYYTAPPFTHLLQTVTKPRGNSTSFEYFSNGQTARVSDSAGRNMRFFYLPLDNETIFVDPRGHSTTFYYNALGNVTRIIKADGNHRDYTFSPDAKVTSAIDEDGFATQITYDAVGNPLSITDALGNVTKIAYDPVFSQPTSITMPSGAVAQLQYDAGGNLTSTKMPLGVITKFTYDGFGELLTATDGEGNSFTYTYDGNGNRLTAADPLQNTTTYQYDNLRRLTGVGDALGNSSSAQWDALDRLTSIVNPLRSSWSVSFDGNGNPAQSVDANGNTTTFTHDALENLGQVKEPGGGLTSYSYATPTCGCMTDTQLTGVDDASGVSQSQGYDFNQWLTTTSDSAGNVQSFAYDARGNVIAKTDANGNTIQYKYDAAGRLLQKTFPGGGAATFSYDANGNLLAAANVAATVTMSYDALNRLSAATDSRFGQTIQYSYDHNGRRTQLVDPTGGVTTYTYDASGRMTSVTNPAGNSAQFSYDALGRPIGLQYSNGIAVSYQYDAAGQPISITATGAGPQVSYTYDANGNPASITDPAGMHSYQFDPLNRLTSAAGASAENYTYDGAGNRLSSVSGGYTYDAAGRLTTGEGFSYSYDKNGNLTSRTGPDGTTTYAYDPENHLIAIQSPNGTVGYLYDALGRRIQKNVNGTVTNYLYDGSDILLEMDAGGAMSARYARGPGIDRVLTMERNGQIYFYHANAIGSVLALTDASGNAACSYNYDSFGRTQTCAAVANPFGFTGREYDPESGFYYMRARYYDPVTGRFITNDPLNITGRLLLTQSGQAGALAAKRSPQQLNPYSYAVNNPLVFTDPSGMNCQGPILPAQITTTPGHWVNATITTPNGNWWYGTLNGVTYLFNQSGGLVASVPASSKISNDTNSWVAVTPSGNVITGGVFSGQGAVSPALINDATNNAPGNNNPTTTLQGLAAQNTYLNQQDQQQSAPYYNQLSNDWQSYGWPSLFGGQ